MTGGISPNRQGWLLPFAARMSNKKHAKEHQVITEAVHQHQGKICLQILHDGRYGYHPFVVAPSAVKSPINPFKPKNHMDTLGPLLPERYSPIRADGSGNQVYLAEIPEPMAASLLSFIGPQLNVAIKEGQEHAIKNRTDINTTEKYQLVRSRVGQGQYRSNLERHETGCRISGITDGRFLTASHVKPWAKSTDFEKLDGNNGLLLSPHIDRLFDRGYISFEDSCQLIFSPLLQSDVIDAWALSKPAVEKPLSRRQSAYMSFYRSEIYRTRE